MIEDFSNASAGLRALHFDVCIAGGGAAGITLAMALASANLRIGIFEGGGLEPPDSRELDLYAGTADPKTYSLSRSRLRYLGGSTNHWGGWCRPLDEIDFERRDYIDLSGWPVTRGELSEYYTRAHRICQIESEDYDAHSILRFNKRAILPFPENGGFINKLFRMSPPTRFGKVYRKYLQKKPNIHVFLHANVRNIHSRESRVEGFDIQSLGGNTLVARARYYVVALGGVENARLLLNSMDESPTGIGNHSDFVGRCFMDHFGFHPGFVLTRADLKYFRFNMQNGAVMPIIGMTNHSLRNREMRNFCIHTTPDAYSETFPPEALDNPGFNSFPDDRNGFVQYRLQLINEPTPNISSRVTLTRDRDELGLHRIHLDWRVNDDDLDNVGLVLDNLSRMFGLNGWGRVQRSNFVNEQTREGLGGASHHIGTTRMSTSPNKGVVDSNCRIHGIQNLFVAGSSVFPTAGFANPTLTIVALTERLADHLIDKFKQGSL